MPGYKPWEDLMVAEGPLGNFGLGRYTDPGLTLTGCTPVILGSEWGLWSCLSLCQANRYVTCQPQYRDWFL